MIGPILVEEGLTSYNQWRSFKMFLQNYSKFEDRGIRDLAIWKEFLAYGTALDLSEKITSEVDDTVTIKITNEVKRIVKEVVGTHLMDRIRY